MKSYVKILLVTLLLAALLPELVVSAKKVKKLHEVYNLRRKEEMYS